MARGSRWKSGAVAPLWPVPNGIRKPGLRAIADNRRRGRVIPRRFSMSDVAASSPSLPGAVHPPAISLREIWPWALFVLALLVLIYTVGMEQGATSLKSGNV